MPVTAKLIVNRFPAIIAGLEGRGEIAAKMIAEEIESGAKERVPVGYFTPHLFEAIHTEKVEDGYAVIAGDSKVYYGHMIEYGTTTQGAQPFLHPAAEAVDVVSVASKAALAGL